MEEATACGHAAIQRLLVTRETEKNHLIELFASLLHNLLHRSHMLVTESQVLCRLVEGYILHIEHQTAPQLGKMAEECLRTIRSSRSSKRISEIQDEISGATPEQKKALYAQMAAMLQDEDG